MPIRLQKVSLPEFGLPGDEPVIPSHVYTARLKKLRARMASDGLDILVIYGDREHTANLTYLTGYDPRFEEALLIVDLDSIPALLVGNEGWGYAELARLPMNRVLSQSLSLMGQDRSRSKSLATIFRENGITQGKSIGLAGWKYFTNEEFQDAAYQSEVPSFIVDTLRSIAGAKKVRNANQLFMNPVDGLRIINEPEQIAAFEFASCYTSQGLRNVLFGIREGMTELEAAALMGANGLPLAAHTMLTGGDRAAYGLPSPSTRKLKVGDRFTMAYSIWGALNARAGWFVHSAEDLPEGVRDYVDKLAIPYFEAVSAWYESIGIGVTGGALYDTIHRVIGAPFFGVGLNPGHYIHIDEWVHSPVFKGSEIKLQSGMALQVDVIPATGGAYHTINIEDGIALADEVLRESIAHAYPAMWKRIQARRNFMKEVIGIQLKPEVLPLSNIPAYLPPFILSPDQVLVHHA